MATQKTDTDPEEIEGLGHDEDSSWPDYPIDTFLIRYETRTVHDVLRRIEQGGFVMDPEFQRDFIWDDDKQSKLIESMLMRIPLPVFYLAEDSKGRMVVVDGLQRLSTFRRFVNNGLRLKLPHQAELNRKLFKDISAKFQNRIEDCNLILYIIDPKVPERARLDIFERVNSGLPLTRQQMRNSLYMGPATRFLKDESTTPDFLRATGESLRTSTMRDREFVNRFCAFQTQSPDAYSGDMDEFLADGLKKMNSLESAHLERLSDELRTSLTNNFLLFGDHAFRKHELGQARRSVINASLWDVMSTGLSRQSTQIVEARADYLRTLFFRMLQDQDFVSAITYGTNAMKTVKHRFDTARAMFQEVFGDNSD